ncbi:unnamed protein product [Arabidopsis lyrata]|uniref:Uncharacterized protein n=1 Tax=Arabidopsis lyrata subsp. lyrata TaxID=81972 RepID=D7MJ56_ARALL|nr:uncharacterized protein LOC9304716 [Arabidopsis lyrata subsp. lyrata]EFH46949.1 hypothetical protein ARALYDRAFT_493920 [Arabidopsis lyrata subsp. lyrata]CAH8277677.1 unnamed protein product [Arabidopsis lyrata]|eukprot:XP_002870690.1 uncharacterized protein LOC9304716 [Arabidopsis lyrata subsp. lyrata]
MFRRYFSFVTLIGLALAGGAYAANSSPPSPPSDSSTEKSPPATPSLPSLNATFVPDYSDYEVPMNLAPDGVEIVQDYVPIVQDEDKEADELEGKSDKKANQPKDSASSSSYSSSFVVFVVAAGLFLF